MEEFVVLVNEKDEVLGTMEKHQAHEAGLLHRAFSVFIFDEKGRLLMQKRAATKYHSPSLWTNTCCSHPRETETYLDAAHRRLREEVGFDCELQEKFHFIYRTQFDNGLFEHELDHVFVGNYEGEVQFNPNEVQEIHWISLDDLKNELLDHPDHFTVWFKIIFDEYLNQLSYAGNHQ